MPKRDTPSATVLVTQPTKRQRIQSNNKTSSVGQGIVIDPEHAVALDGKQKYTQEVMQPAPAGNALNQTAQFPFVTENDSMGLIRDLVLRITITCNGANAKLLPTTKWFERIEARDRHKNREICEYFDDTMHWLLMTTPPGVLKGFAEAVNINPYTGRECTKEIVDGETRNYYLVMPHNWVEGFELDMSLLHHDLEWRFFPKGEIRQDPTSAAVITLNEMRWVSMSEMMSDVAHLAFKRSKITHTLQHNFLNFQQYKDPSRVLAAGTAYTVDLQQFEHESAFVLMVLRQSDSGLAGLSSFPIGPRGTIDHKNVHSRSLLGDGEGIDEKFFRQFINTQLWPGCFASTNHVYMIPFSKTPSDALLGKIDGFHSFRGDREKIEFVTGAAATPSSYRITWTGLGAPIGLTVDYMFYRGQQQPRAIDWTNDTAATLTAKLNENPMLIKDNLEVVVTILTGGPGIGIPAGGIISFNIACFQRGTVNSISGLGQPADISKVAFFEPSPALVDLNSAPAYFNVTQGVEGFVPGTYQITLYSAHHRYVQQAMGKITSGDL